MLTTKFTVCAQQVTSVLMEGAQELLGPENVEQILAVSAFSTINAPDSDLARRELVCALPYGLELQYGSSAGRGLALRIGRSAFKYMLARHGDDLGMNATDYRLQRAPQRLAAGLHILSTQFASAFEDSITLTESPAHWVWRSERCPACQRRHSPDACCYLMVGMLQEFLSWADSGRFYRVVETECCASGDSACVYRIDKKPLD